MAFNREQLTALETAAASGTLRVQMGDRAIQYHSLSDLLKAIEMARADVAATDRGHKHRRLYARISRGD